MPASRPAEIDEIWLGHFNGGFVAQDFTSSLVLQADPALRFKPATRVENACATGSAAVHAGMRAIAARDGADRARGGRGEDDRACRPGRSARRCCAAPTSSEEKAHRGRLRRRVRPDRADATSSAMATSPTRWPRSPPRTTRTAAPTPMPSCARIWASSSAAPSPRRTRSWPARSSAPTARWSPTAPRPWS